MGKGAGENVAPATRRRPSRAKPARRLASATLSVAASVALLAGCTAIPTSGKVHAGAPNGFDQGDSQVHVPAQPPVAGETPDQIVDGFRQASADAADLSVARAYLSDANWQPDQGVRVIDEPVAPSFSATGDHANVHFVDKWVGTIKPDGTYQPQKDGTTLDYTYELSRAKGEWRIVNPPNYSTSTVSGVDDFYDQNYLYFLSPRSQLLVPVRVFLPSVRDKATELVSQLLQGPPKWLADAGVTSAIPDDTTLVEAVSEDNDRVVTVNLSAEFAGVSAAGRDAASAQLVYTLQHFGGGEFNIEAAGQPIPAGPQSAKKLSAYDPDALKVDSFYYVGLGGRTFASNGFPVTGDAGSGAIKFATPVVAPRLADTPGTELIAGVQKGTSSQTLYVGPLTAPKSVAYGVSFTTPSWDAFGNVWTVRQSAASSQQEVMVSAVTHTGATKFLSVANPQLAASDLIESLKVSRDGTRVAVIARSAASGPQLLVGHVVNTDSGESIEGFYPVAPSLAPVPDGVVWASSTTLDVLATAAGATSPRVWTLDVDGWEQTPVTTAPLSAVVAIAAAPNQPLVIATKAGDIEVYRNDDWKIVGSGGSPSYPG